MWHFIFYGALLAMVIDRFCTVRKQNRINTRLADLVGELNQIDAGQQQHLTRALGLLRTAAEQLLKLEIRVAQLELCPNVQQGADTHQVLLLELTALGQRVRALEMGRPGGAQ
jgi:hypothetical protein